MPITIITGTPGAGKTLLALEMFFDQLGVDATSEETLRATLKNAKRPHAICGVEGLKPGLFNEIESAMDWQTLEDGTLVLVDEGWKWWGKHLTHIKTDPRYLELAEHRHRGFDFIVTTQGPSQLQDHVRALAATHHHVMRKFGTSHTMKYEWSVLQESPNSPSIRKQAIESHWTQPWKKIGWVYQSATQHTIKRKLPLKVLMLPVVSLAVIALGFAAWKSVSSIGSNVVPEARAAGGEQADGATGKRKDDKPMTREEWARRFQPRFATMPMSAPVFDDRDVVAEPRVACMIGEKVGCICKTEQGTPWTFNALDKRAHERVCREVVLAGGVYDYFREPEENPAQYRSNASPQPVAIPQPGSAKGTSSYRQVAPQGQFRNGGLSPPDAYPTNGS